MWRDRVSNPEPLTYESGALPIALHSPANIGIKHGFSCINICQVPREMLKTEAEDRHVVGTCSG